MNFQPLFYKGFYFFIYHLYNVSLINHLVNLQFRLESLEINAYIFFDIFNDINANVSFINRFKISNKNGIKFYVKKATKKLILFFIDEMEEIIVLISNLSSISIFIYYNY
jgi:hypothetical protein